MTIATAEGIVEAIENSMATDDEPNSKKGRRLMVTYDAATDGEKAIVDDIFITLCGFSLKTIRKDWESL